MGATQCCSVERVASSKLSKDRLAEGSSPILVRNAAEENRQITNDVSKKSGLWERGAKAASQLRLFRSFLKQHFTCPGDAFDEMFQGCILPGQKVEKDVFVVCSRRMGFEGDAGLLFDLVKDKDMLVSRDTFKSCLKNTENSFAGVVKQVMESKKTSSDDSRSSSDDSRRSSNSSSDNGRCSFQSDTRSVASMSTSASTPPLSPKLPAKKKQEGTQKKILEQPEKRPSKPVQNETRSQCISPKLRARVTRSTSPKYPPLRERVTRPATTSKFHTSSRSTSNCN